MRCPPGTNALIRLGATPVTRVEDVLELYDLEPVSRRADALGSAADAILSRVRDRPSTGDELVRASGIAPGDVAAALTELELSGAVTLEEGVYRVSV